jgi:hypothetical protein
VLSGLENPCIMPDTISALLAARQFLLYTSPPGQRFPHFRGFRAWSLALRQVVELAVLHPGDERPGSSRVRASANPNG